MRPYDPRQPLISLHIPKCAGQSMRQILAGWFGPKFFVHYYQQYQALPAKIELAPGICIHGHFNQARGFGLREYYPEARQLITVWRDPLAAAISNYFFWKRKSRAMQLARGEYRPGDDRDYRSLDDYFWKQGYSRLLDFMPAGLTAGNYREILESRFIAAGLVESFSDFIRQLAGILGREPVPPVCLNQSPVDEELSPDLREQFLETHRLEYQIYDYIKKMNEAGA